MSFLEEIWWKSVLKVQFLRAKKFITWRSWLILNPFRWPKFRLDIIYVFISHGWKPISIRRSSKMWIYQVFSCRKFVTSLFASCSKNHNLVDFHRIELVPAPKFHKLSWLHFHRRYWVQTVFKRPSFFAQSAWHAENPECWILFHLGRNFENS